MRLKTEQRYDFYFPPTRLVTVLSDVVLVLLGTKFWIKSVVKLIGLRSVTVEVVSDPQESRLPVTVIVDGGSPITLLLLPCRGRLQLSGRELYLQLSSTCTKSVKGL